MNAGVALPADIAVVCGASGTGKSAWTKQRIATAARACVFDADDEYSAHGFKVFRDLRTLIRTMKGARAGRFAFVPRQSGNAHAFDVWSQAVFAWGNCTAVAEETADVTSPGKAPPGWGTLIRRGRKRGIRLFAVTQRPSESDKTVIGNATLLHCCALARAQDRDYMARELDCDPRLVSQLRPLEFLERNRATGQLTQGTVTPGT